MGPDRGPEQPRGLEPGPIESGPAQPVPPPTERGSERFNWRMGAIIAVASIISLNITEAAVTLLTGNKLLGELAAFPSGILFGLVIPLQIYNWSTHTSWRDRWNKLIS